MTIDEAIENYKKDSKFFNDEFEPHLAKEYKQVAEWLERLKFLQAGQDTIYREVYNKAIDDFVKFASDMPIVDEDGEKRPMWLEEMAEKLKKE